MPDELKPPVAIRITRPYASEAEFLEREFDTLTHTSVVLLGAQARPQGVVLRFEIVLKTGESILRGEGRVVGYKDKAYSGEPGLTLRFTRLDSRSKTLVDRAASLRDARVRASTSLMSMPAVVVPKPVDSAPPRPPTEAAPMRRIDSPPPPSGRRGPPPLPPWARSAPPPPLQPAPLPDIEATQVDAHFQRDPSPPIAAQPPAPALKPPRPLSSRPPPLPRSPSPPVVSAPVRSAPGAPIEPIAKRTATTPKGEIDRPADRDALLARLRTRAHSLSADRVRAILTKSAHA